MQPGQANFWMGILNINECMYHGQLIDYNPRAWLGFVDVPAAGTSTNGQCFDDANRTGYSTLDKSQYGNHQSINTKRDTNIKVLQIGLCLI
ncbi:hypothetical protein KSZ_67760 [Dictyobacter formicarum]|uniref:Uncharacterized protein n=1 Tax=Dictyobacter formicarum TaxID=2778368 RepID=A0ABQ3VSI2_9CHLR|nr:hypothetical protein KSZ_67760 [Dictyobacter formicarum]